MKKVLIVASDGLSKSGVPTTFMNIIHGLKSRYSFDVLYFDKMDDFYSQEINSFGGRAIYCPIDAQRTNKLKKINAKLMYRKTIKRIILENGPYDVIHSFKGFESGYILKAARQCGVNNRIAHKTFVYRKTNNLFINLLEKIELKLTIKYSTTIIADSAHSLNNPKSLVKKGIVIKPFVDDNI